MSERLTAAVGTVWLELIVRFHRAAVDRNDARIGDLHSLIDRLETEFPDEVRATRTNHSSPGENRKPPANQENSRKVEQ